MKRPQLSLPGAHAWTCATRVLDLNKRNIILYIFVLKEEMMGQLLHVTSKLSGQFSKQAWLHCGRPSQGPIAAGVSSASLCGAIGRLLEGGVAGAGFGVRRGGGDGGERCDDRGAFLRALCAPF